MCEESFELLAIIRIDSLYYVCEWCESSEKRFKWKIYFHCQSVQSIGKSFQETPCQLGSLVYLLSFVWVHSYREFIQSIHNQNTLYTQKCPEEEKVVAVISG